MKTAILGWDSTRGVVSVQLGGVNIAKDLKIVDRFMKDEPWRQSSATEPEGPENVLSFVAALLVNLGFEIHAGAGVVFADGKWLH